eukprot:scaffold14992_cov69-Phaeocystis_antarctica.AAC.1
MTATVHSNLHNEMRIFIVHSWRFGRRRKMVNALVRSRTANIAVKKKNLKIPLGRLGHSLLPNAFAKTGRIYSGRCFGHDAQGLTLVRGCNRGAKARLEAQFLVFVSPKTAHQALVSEIC